MPSLLMATALFAYGEAVTRWPASGCPTHLDDGAIVRSPVTLNIYVILYSPVPSSSLGTAATVAPIRGATPRLGQ